MKQISIWLITALLFTGLESKAQNTFDPKGGCLNIINASSGPGIAPYGNRTYSFTYHHEILCSEQFSMGGGIGYTYHDKYRMALMPVFFSCSYFFLDKPFSPYANMRVGWFGILKKNESTPKTPI